MVLIYGSVLSHLLDFVPPESYLFEGCVSKDWNLEWGERDKKTRCITEYTSLQQLQFAFECGLRRKSLICERASLLSRKDLFIYAKENGCSIGNSLDMAYKSGDIEMISLVSSFSGPGSHASCFSRAVKYNHKHVLDWIYSIYGHTDIHPEFLFDISISNNSVVGLKWLISNSLINIPTFIHGDNHPGISIEMLTFLGSMGIRLSNDQVQNISKYCAYSGNTSILSWLAKNEYNISLILIHTSASIGGRSNVLRWIQEFYNQ
jgi:hypothetical protein